MSKMVYLVTCGSYSDYRVEGVFSTKEMAQKFIEVTYDYSRWAEPIIEEYTLDPRERDLGRGLCCFFGRVNEAGDIFDVHLGGPDSSYTTFDDAFDHSNNLCARVWAENADHARKIIAERHAVVKSQGWPGTRDQGSSYDAEETD